MRWNIISISRQTDYACRVILHLATLPSGTRVTAQEIAKRRIIPRALVRRIVTRLGKAGLIATTRGLGGGFTLARAISLLDVTQAMEGELMLNACVATPHACPLMDKCSVYEVWLDAHAQLTARLRQATFDKLAQRARALER